MKRNKPLRKEVRRINTAFWSVIAIIGVIAGLIFINKSDSRMNDPVLPLISQLRENVASGYQAPSFELKNVSGKVVKLSDFKGQVVLLNFWATWCGPCKREIPDFINLQNKYLKNGFTIVGIALDQQDAVSSFVKRTNINYPTLIGNRSVAEKYGNIQSIPTSFLIDRRGKITDIHVGYRPIELWERDIEKLF